MTTECNSVHILRSTAELAHTHKTREGKFTKKRKEKHNSVTSPGEAVHHKAPECIEKSQRGRNRVI